MIMWASGYLKHQLFIPQKSVVILQYKLISVQSVSITTKVVGSNPVHGEVYSIKHHVIKFVSDLLQVGGFLRFPSPIKLTATI